MKRWLVPGVPFVLSIALSACTVGRTVGWQDSGFFLAGVKELGVLYPPGFVLYLILCRAWTLALGFLDFTLAVHLFSSACVAGTAALLALASRDLIRDRLPEAPSEIPAIVAGCLAASGFTLWSAALLAKGYALFFLVLSALIWRMLRRDFTGTAILIGLAWAAHPSAASLGLAFVLFVVANRSAIGAKGIAWRSGVAAACAIGPSLLLPVLALRDPGIMFGKPTSVAEWLGYLTGGRFVGLPGVFGLDSWRVLHALRDFWEEFLVVGIAAAIVGMSRLAVLDRKLLLGMLAWSLPSALVAVLFRIEGQLDFWLVASWLPLYPAIAVGVASIPLKAARLAGAAAGVAGVAWAVAANAASVSMRGDTLAEQFGRFHLEKLEKDAILLLESDDALATTRYLQLVKGERTDVLVVDAGRLGSAWYVDYLRRRDPRLKAGSGARGFAEANVSLQRPVYFEAAPPDLGSLSPRGPLMRLAAEGDPNEPQAWEFPVSVEQARAKAGRQRGIRLQMQPNDLIVEPEPYTRRWIAAYARAQAQQGYARFRKGDYRGAADLLESANGVEPDRPSLEVLHLLGVCRFLLNEYDRAEPLLKGALRLGPTSRQAVRACTYLSTICRKQGRMQEALRWQEQAMSVVGSDPDLRREFDQFNRPR